MGDVYLYIFTSCVILCQIYIIVLHSFRLLTICHSCGNGLETDIIPNVREIGRVSSEIWSCEKMMFS